MGFGVGKLFNEVGTSRSSLVRKEKIVSFLTALDDIIEATDQKIT